MSTTSSQLQTLVTAAKHPSVHASFRRKWGIPPRGDRNAPDSQWGFPVPDYGHPQAVAFAHAVLRRAGQAKNFSADDVAKQVRKAKSIIARHQRSKKAEGKWESWRSVTWVDTHRTRGGRFIGANPRKTETAKEFLARVPGAMPAAIAAKLSETEKRVLAARARGLRMRESAGGAVAAGGTMLRERSTSNVAFCEATAGADGVVKGVLLLRAGPGNLADRHWYSEQAISAAAASGVFEGTQMYLDHPDPLEERTGVRSVKHLAGWYSDVVAKPYKDPEIGDTLGLFADLHPAVGNAKALEIIRTCAEYAKRYPRKAYAGLSICAVGDGQPDTINGEQWDRVDRITEADSVDIVARAGAGGAIVPLKESYRMKDFKLTLDADKVREGVINLAESGKANAKTALKKVLEAGGVQLTPEQDQELDRTLGVVDGGALDKVLDAATGVEEDEGTIEGGGAEPGAQPAGAPKQPAGGGGVGDDIESMTEDEAKAALRRERAARTAAESKVTEANRTTSVATRSLRERMADDVLSQMNIPETFRPRLRTELLQEGFATEKQMREHAQAFDKAFIRPVIETGGGHSAAGSGGGASKIDFDFGGNA